MVTWKSASAFKHQRLPFPRLPAPLFMGAGLGGRRLGTILALTLTQVVPLHESNLLDT